MTDELQTFITELLPPSRGVHLTDITVEKASLRLQLMGTAPIACRPGYVVPSSSVHSRYQRHMTDLPWAVHSSHVADGAEIRAPECRLHAPHLHRAPAGPGIDSGSAQFPATGRPVQKSGPSQAGDRFHMMPATTACCITAWQNLSRAPASARLKACVECD
jgi:hypothetical protein